MNTAAARKAWTLDDLHTPPRVDEAERAILGAILLDNAAIELVGDTLRPEDFYSTAHQIIYGAMLHLLAAREAIDNVTLTERLRASGQLSNSKGSHYIGELIVETVSAANIVSHARLVSEKAKIRKLQAQAVRMLTAIEHGADFKQVLSLLPEHEPAHEPVDIGTTSPENLPWRNSLVIVREPPPDNKWLLHGLIPQSSVVLLSGREGTMKSWLGTDWSSAIAAGNPWLGRESESGAVCYIDAEMPRHLFLARLFAAGPSLNLNSMRWDEKDFPTTLDHPSLLLAAQHHRLLVIDTLRRFMEGRDENSSNDMAVITGKLRHLTKWGASVLVLHHGVKDAERGGYRGSTELGAGVDVCLDLVKKRDADGEEQLHLTASKTRYSDDHRLILTVERTLARPVFHDSTGVVQANKLLAKESDKAKIGEIIRDLSAQGGAAPSQSDIVDAAGKAKLGSRMTVIRWLREGEGTSWRSELNGRSRTYTVPTCIPRDSIVPVDRLYRPDDVSNLSRGAIGKRQDRSLMKGELPQ